MSRSKVSFAALSLLVLALLPACVRWGYEGSSEQCWDEVCLELRRAETAAGVDAAKSNTSSSDAGLSNTDARTTTDAKGTTVIPTNDSGTTNPPVTTPAYPAWTKLTTADLSYSGAPLVDIEVKIIVDTQSMIQQGELRSDCGDLRFSQGAGLPADILPYFIEAGCNTPSTITWVQADLSGNTRINIHHGNPSATSASNGNAVFALFDDFSSNSLDTNKWQDWNPSNWGSITFSGGVMRISGTATAGPSDPKSRGPISKQPFAFSDHIIEISNRWNFQQMTANGDNVQKEIQISDVASPTGSEVGNQMEFDYQHYCGFAGINTGSYRFTLINNSVVSEPAKRVITNGAPAAFQQEQYHWRAGPNQQFLRSTDGGNTFQSQWTATNNFWPLPTSKYVGFVLENLSAKDHWVELDWIRIRKYSASPYTVTFN